MGMRRVPWGVVVCAVFGLPALASAQPVTATGRALGARFTLGGTEVFVTSDTGTQSATAPGSFSETADSEAVIPLAPLLELSSGPTSTTGTGGDASSGDGALVDSVAGDATLRVLVAQAPGGLDVIEVVSDGAQARLECDTATGLSFTATSEVNALVIAGNVVPIPGEVEPNTVIIAEDLAIITLNAQELVENPAGTVTLQVTAAKVQLVTTGELLTYDVSHASAQLGNLPDECRLDGGDGGANLGQSRKTGTILNDVDDDGRPDSGDRIGYTITIQNTGDEAATAVVIRDRVPLGLTLDNTSFELDGVPVTPTFAACPGDVSFPGCPGENAQDDTRQCFTVNVGSVEPDDSAVLTFEGTVNAGTSEEDICNVARAGGGNVPEFPLPPAIIIGGGGGGGGVTGDTLQTFGSGGCAAVPGERSALDGLMIAVVALGLALRRRQRTN